MKRLLRLLMLLLVFVAALLGAVAYDARQQLAAPLPLQQPQRVDIPAGSRLRDALGVLQERSLLSNSRQAAYLELWARYTGDAGRIRSGEYELRPGVTPRQLLAMWVRGDVVLHELRVIEGTRFADVLQQIRSNTELVSTLGGASVEDIMKTIGRPGLHPEGRLFPDTYRFPKGETDAAFLRRAFAAMDALLSREWQGRSAHLPYANVDDALVMASIIEKETGLAAERPEIAGVFVRRLQRGMRLQTDPTVIYGLGERFDGNLRKRDLLEDGPYNSYLREGLPPTPICLTGRASLHAALHPSEGNALYFVARGDGSHQFSATLEEHEAAVRKYQLKRNP
jgi:UPF0755 protein